MTIKPPFFEIGPKSYLYGDDVLALSLTGRLTGLPDGHPLNYQ